MTFTYTELKNTHKNLYPQYKNIDATTYDAWADAAIKPSLAQMQSQYLAALDTFLRGSTLTASAASTGTAVVDTTVGDAYKIALAAGASQVAGDVIWIYSTTDNIWKDVPRVALESIITGGTGETVIAFYEVEGFIIVYMKDSTFTTIPADVHYDYWRDLTAPSAGTDPVDIKPEDWLSFISIFAQYMPAY
jgi:hypothetical protein